MKMTPQQSKLAELTLELDLKAREYKKLCEEFEELKKDNIDTNSQEYINLKNRFLKNQKDIKVIHDELKKLQKND